MAELGVFSQLDNIGPEDISIDPALKKDFNYNFNIDKQEQFTDFVKNNKIWIIIAFIVIIVLILIFIKIRK